MKANPPKPGEQDSTLLVRQRFLVQGIVQGVGFRPFVYTLATQHGLTGFVGNDSAGVFIEVEGAPAALVAFQQALMAQPPPLAHIERIVAEPRPVVGDPAFTILPSQTIAAAHTLISPDLAICAACLRELFDPQDRRYRYPFINCTHCGPRFTITRDLPYDRPLTTMAAFRMCPACQAEYDDPANRRFHAQPNACPVCGPQVELLRSPLSFSFSSSSSFFSSFDSTGESTRRSTRKSMRMSTGQTRLVVQDKLQYGKGEDETTDPISAAQQLLANGAIVAVKGIGGFHLACDATNEQAVQLLRQRKNRIDKPFALMAWDVATVRTFAEVSAAEQQLLESRQRPIVLLRKRQDVDLLAPSIAPGNQYVGVMLPYTPLHYLLLANPFIQEASANRGQDPYSALPIRHSILVLTSGNYTDEPIVSANEAALRQLGALADAFLLHNRDIYVPCDDSVVRVLAGAELPIRRSRGYAPFPVKLPWSVAPIVAVGGELKSTFCLTRDDHAFLSQHIGDMQNLETMQAFEHTLAHMQTIFRVTPTCLACDRHPGYLSTRWAEEHAQGRPLIRVQHHHAHIAAVLAEHGLDGQTPVIGFSFDGTGYGDDGAIWGGEVLVADYKGYHRAAHLKYTPLPGGDAAVKRPYRLALAQLWAAGVAWDETLPPVAACPPVERKVLAQQLTTGFQCVPTSSMGRLFDAVAALLGVRQTITYEGQAAIELEALAGDAGELSYHFDLGGDDPLLCDPAPLIRAVVRDLQAGQPVSAIAAAFHQAVAALIVTLAGRIRQRTGLQQVALSGGVFQNVRLLELAMHQLQAQGFTVLVHRLAPPNDGGLALGQAVIANFMIA